MTVHVCLPLFGDPGRELEEVAAVRGRDLRDLAARLQERLEAAADTVDRLLSAGWSARMGAYDVVLSRPDLRTESDATRTLREAGIDPAALIIFEEPDGEVP